MKFLAPVIFFAVCLFLREQSANAVPLQNQEQKTHALEACNGCPMYDGFCDCGDGHPFRPAEK